MEDAQRAVLAELVQGVGAGGYDALRPMLEAASHNRVWVTPPLIAVAAGLVRVLTDELDERPWRANDALWEQYLPDQRPSGRSGWSRSNLALHAAASLAGGVWLDVAATESYWRTPMWPAALDVVELLTCVAIDRCSLTADVLAARLTALLDVAPPAADLL
jgi:hypothetical protein